jgi:small subunit ribosomal protein S6
VDAGSASMSRMVLAGTDPPRAGWADDRDGSPVLGPVAERIQRATPAGRRAADTLGVRRARGRIGHYLLSVHARQDWYGGSRADLEPDRAVFVHGFAIGSWYARQIGAVRVLGRLLGKMRLGPRIRRSGTTETPCYASAPFPFGSAPALPPAGRFPLEGVHWRMRRYELMLVLRPDVADDKAQAVIDRTTRQLIADGGQIIKVAPWGRRRLAYQIDRYREGSYHIVLFEAPPAALAEMERTLQITEEVLRHLVTRDERPARPGRRDGTEEGGEESDDTDLPSAEDEDDEDVAERIDESETEAAPAAID